MAVTGCLQQAAALSVCAKTSMSGQAAYFEVWCPTLSNKWCGKKSAGKTPSPGLLLWGFLWEALRLSHPLLSPMWCSVIITHETISGFQELLQCWTSTLRVFFFSLCSVFCDPEEIVLCPLCFFIHVKKVIFPFSRVVVKVFFFNPLPDVGCCGGAKHLAVIDLFIRQSWCYFRDPFFTLPLQVICWKCCSPSLLFFYHLYLPHPIYVCV